MSILCYCAVVMPVSPVPDPDSQAPLTRTTLQRLAALEEGLSALTDKRSFTQAEVVSALDTLIKSQSESLMQLAKTTEYFAGAMRRTREALDKTERDFAPEQTELPPEVASAFAKLGLDPGALSGVLNPK